MDGLMDKRSLTLEYLKKKDILVRQMKLQPECQ